MSKKDDEFLLPSAKKLRFRGDLNLYHFENHVEDIFDDVDRRKSKGDQQNEEAQKKGKNALMTHDL